MVGHGVTKISLPPPLYTYDFRRLCFSHFVAQILWRLPHVLELWMRRTFVTTTNPKGLFKRREGCPCARVTLACKRGVKVSSGLQANFTGRVTLSPGSTLSAFLTCFIIRYIICNDPRFKIILKFSIENTLIHEKNGKLHQCRQKIIFCFSDVDNYAQKLDNAVQIGTITGHAWRRKVDLGRWVTCLVNALLGIG